MGHLWTRLWVFVSPTKPLKQLTSAALHTMSSFGQIWSTDGAIRSPHQCSDPQYLLRTASGSGHWNATLWRTWPLGLPSFVTPCILPLVACCPRSEPGLTIPTTQILSLWTTFTNLPISWAMGLTGAPSAQTPNGHTVPLTSFGFPKWHCLSQQNTI